MGHLGHQIDTAEGYDTERLVGQAIRKSNKPRSHFFVTTKISTGHPSQEAYAAALQASLDRLGLGRPFGIPIGISDSYGPQNMSTCS